MSKKSTSRKGSDRIHVISRSSGWAVKKERRNRASKVYGSKVEAVRGAQKMAKRGGSDVIVHRRDGSIQRWKKSK